MASAVITIVLMFTNSRSGMGVRFDLQFDKWVGGALGRIQVLYAHRECDQVM
jgi:hypothetical protein